jgi:hypothetical protein
MNKHLIGVPDLFPPPEEHLFYSSKERNRERRTNFLSS